jgi:hypothetical protein
MPESTSNESPEGTASRTDGSDVTKNLHVKCVPVSAWRRARRNALDSGVAFRDFIIHLLATSQPLPSGHSAGDGVVARSE